MNTDLFLLHIIFSCFPTFLLNIDIFPLNAVLFSDGHLLVLRRFPQAWGCVRRAMVRVAGGGNAGRDRYPRCDLGRDAML